MTKKAFLISFSQAKNSATYNSNLPAKYADVVVTQMLMEQPITF